MRLRPLVAVLVASAASLAAAGPAGADHGDRNLPWPSALQPQEVSTRFQPSAPRGCRRPRLSCVDRVIRRMTLRWRRLDRRCDHRAVFALTYLRTTEGFRRTLRRHPRFFKYRSWVLYEDVIFADYYFRAYDRWKRRRPVPDAWRIAFDAATGGRTGQGQTNAGQDLFMGMNAHIQRDLPYVLAEVGLRTRRGASRKRDHDKVNRILTRVLDPIQDEVGARYDQLLTLTDLKPFPGEELGALELLKSWREGAWRNAERLLRARTRAERLEVQRSIELGSRLWAEAFRSGEVAPGYGPVRDAYCHSRG